MDDKIREVLCPICGGRIKAMYKPDKQYHCGGECGLIIRLQDESKDWHKEIDTMISEYGVLKGADTIVKELEKMFPDWMRYRDILECISFHKSALSTKDTEIAELEEYRDSADNYISDLEKERKTLRDTEKFLNSLLDKAVEGLRNVYACDNTAIRAIRIKETLKEIHDHRP